jgi:hypothetical protein
MAIQDDRRDEASGAEKSPSNVGKFLLFILIGVILALGAVLLYLHYHSIGMR